MKPKHTKDEWQVADSLDKDTGERSLAVWEGETKTICLVSPIGSETAEDIANANLIAEAGTVKKECGLTPRQLLEQRNDLLKALEAVTGAKTPFYDACLAEAKGLVKECKKSQFFPSEVKVGDTYITAIGQTAKCIEVLEHDIRGRISTFETCITPKNECQKILRTTDFKTEEELKNHLTHD